jgi:hypothetical protein
MIETSQNDRFLLRITLIRQDLLALHTHKLYKHGMANSPFVSCELQRPDKNYDWIRHRDPVFRRPVDALAGHAVVCEDKTFGGTDPRRIKPALDRNDQVVVIDATNNRMASINLRADASKQLYDQGFLRVT